MGPQWARTAKPSCESKPESSSGSVLASLRAFSNRGRSGCCNQHPWTCWSINSTSPMCNARAEESGTSETPRHPELVRQLLGAQIAVAFVLQPTHRDDHVYRLIAHDAAE